MGAHEDRFVELDGVFNFRDLGGLSTSDGATTQSRVMFRSDALHHLAPAAVDQLVDFGIRTIIDLRSTVELEHSGRGPPLTHGDAAAGNALPPALVEGDLGRHYVESLPERSVMLARVITHLADRDNLPAVFHCTAGKDRTGMVAALVLSLVGVHDEVIVHDYTLTTNGWTRSWNASVLRTLSPKRPPPCSRESGGPRPRQWRNSSPHYARTMAVPKGGPTRQASPPQHSPRYAPC